MAASRPSRVSLVTTASLAVAFLGWTLLVAAGKLDRFDQLTTAHGLQPGSAGAEIWAAIAIVAWPGTAYVTLAIMGLWAYRRRLRNLAYAQWLAIPLGWLAHSGLKELLKRPRPQATLDLITAHGWAYPSAHVAAATILVGMIVTTLVVTRRSRFNRGLGWSLGIAGVLLVMECRWILQAHWVSDIIGGILLGALVTALSLLIAGVHVLPDNPFELALPRPVRPTGKRCYVIVNPTKVLDMTTFRRHVNYELHSRGWAPALWLETAPDDPGLQMAKAAIKGKADLVLAVGGDGTIRAVCEGLAGSGIPVGMLPAGTGNLLARNLGISLDESLALRTALDGKPSPTDLVQLTVDPGTDNERTLIFGVMAGIGVDAAIMENTNADLKRAVGPAAYVLSVAQNAIHPALKVTVQVDNHPPFQRKAAVILIGNVGLVTGNIELIPGADATDGVLDVLVASPRTPADWARLIAKVLTRRRGDDDRLDLAQGKRVRIESEQPDAYQVDGDTEGHCSVLEAEIMPSALMVMR